MLTKSGLLEKGFQERGQQMVKQLSDIGLVINFFQVGEADGEPRYQLGKIQKTQYQQ